MINSSILHNQLGLVALSAEQRVALLDRSFDAIAVVMPDSWHLVFANVTFAEWAAIPASVASEVALEPLFAASWHDCAIEEKIKEAARDGRRNFEVQIQLAFPQKTGPARMRIFRLESEDLQPLVAIVMQPTSTQDSAAVCLTTRRDPLTNLPDRTFLFARIAHRLLSDRAFAVLFIDLDGFKHVNDRHGHLLGDRVLCEVASRLQKCVRHGDHVTRYGGDEFVVLLEHVTSRDEIEPVVARIQAALTAPIVLSEGDFVLSLSIGVAQATPDHQTPEDILAEADQQMYAVKRRL